MSFLPRGPNVVAQALLRYPALRSQGGAQLAAGLTVGVSDARAGIASVVGLTRRIAAGQGAGALRREPALENALSPFSSLDQAMARYGSSMGPIVSSPEPLPMRGPGRVSDAARLYSEAGAGTAANDFQDAAMTLFDWLQANGCTAQSFPECTAFQQSWNANGGSPQLAVDGEFGPCTSSALARTGMTYSSCYPGTCQNGQYVPPSGPPGPAPPLPSPPSPTPPSPSPTPPPAPTPSSGGGSGMLLALAAAAAGGWLLWRRRKKKGSRGGHHK